MVRRAAIALSCALVSAACAGRPAAEVAPAATPEATGTPVPTLAVAPAVQGQRPPGLAVGVFQRNERSVVSVVSLALGQQRGGAVARPRGMGSGFVFDGQGHIVTNNHVIAEAASRRAPRAARRTTSPRAAPAP